MNYIKWLFTMIKENYCYKNKTKEYIYYLDNDNSNNITVMTFNIRRDCYKDGINSWYNRKNAIVKMIISNRPDIICLQEVMPHMAKYLMYRLSSIYEFKGIECFTNKDLTKSNFIFGEGLLTLYRKDRFGFVNKHIIPLKDARPINLRRAFVTFLYDRNTYKIINIINTHFCAISRECRKQSFDILYNYYKDCLNPDDTYICGDFNCSTTWTDNGIEIFTNNFNYNKSELGTINNFKQQTKLIIDYIFTNTIINNTKVMDSELETNYLSDHNPVIIN